MRVADTVVILSFGLLLAAVCACRPADEPGMSREGAGPDSGGDGTTRPRSGSPPPPPGSPGEPTAAPVGPGVAPAPAGSEGCPACRAGQACQGGRCVDDCRDTSAITCEAPRVCDYRSGRCV